MPPSLGLFVLIHVFPALLPPIPEDEVDYYETLGVDSNSSQEEIRKAYKKISLRLHPDKLAQRGKAVTDQDQEEYQHVQEAYAVLSDARKRKRYNQLGKSPTRYKFITNGDLYNAAAQYQHLTKSSAGQKTRIVLVLAVFICLVLLQPILICTKINHDLEESGGALADTPWTVILIPTWILHGFLVLLWLALAILIKFQQVLTVASLLEQVFWYSGELCMALKWDDSIAAANWSVVFVPIYLAIATRFARHVYLMSRIQSDVNKMVTLPQLEEIVGKPLRDLTDDEKKELEQHYCIVHVPPDVQADLQSHNDDDDIDFDPIELSPEYQAATKLYYKSSTALLNWILFGIPQLVLIVLKVNGAKLQTTNWWTIFTPLWIYMGSRLLWNFHQCCCGPNVGEQVVMVSNAHNDDDDDNGEGNANDEEQQQQQDDAPSSSEILFSSPESDTSDFFKSVKTKKQGQDDKYAADDPVISATTKTKEVGGDEEKVADESNKPGAASLSKAAAASTAKESVKPAPTTPTRNDDNDDNPDVVQGDDETFDPHIDQETWEQWQSAYQEAQDNAVEAQAKAQANCCSLLFQLTILCLVVGKLNQALDDNDNDSGYNAMWILFPVFLVAGCMLCCCACLIYGAGADGMDGLVDRVMTEKEEDGNGDEEAPAASPSAAETSEPAATTTETSEPVKASSEVDAKAGAAGTSDAPRDSDEEHDLD